MIKKKLIITYVKRGWVLQRHKFMGPPEAQIITNINLQHQDLFGVNTLKEVIKIKVGYLSKKTNIYMENKIQGFKGN